MLNQHSISQMSWLRKGFHCTQITVNGIAKTHEIFIMYHLPSFPFSLLGRELAPNPCFLQPQILDPKLPNPQESSRQWGEDNLFRELLCEEENNFPFPIWNIIRKTTLSWLILFVPFAVCRPVIGVYFPVQFHMIWKRVSHAPWLTSQTQKKTLYSSYPIPWPHITHCFLEIVTEILFSILPNSWVNRIATKKKLWYGWLKVFYQLLENIRKGSHPFSLHYQETVIVSRPRTQTQALRNGMWVLKMS